ncbi:MAG: dioxygenase [Geminicoccaceae bacterium]|nr:dioxygenase [Geminicoccaceae bacterium]MCX8101496.1 dioxygenase [Geminicoccaceae bacterium]MDW8371068.1 class III extradiol ring-cleavage dioxygenase [Geminicoccaceae bacterium]
MDAMPALFVTHGAPTLVLEDHPAARFLERLSGLLPRPRAILVASAHLEALRPVLTAGERPPTVHDFAGFPAALSAIRYPAPGDPALARRAADLLAAAGFAAELDPAAGFDHGVWVPLALAWPAADVPVVALSVVPSRDAAFHLRLGEALRPLRADGVLILGSGSLTHNLGAVRWNEAEPAPEALAFAAWIADALGRGDRRALADWRELAPFAAWNHPSPEHLLPLHVAVGAGTPGRPGRLLHRSVAHRALVMDVWALD